jgi:glycosyltransferase involved in cell wall biosynthesis
MSYGCPAIVSDRCGCVPELVTDGETGWVVGTGDPVDLALKMHRIVSGEPSYKNFAYRCVDRAALYTPERAAGSILRACEDVLCIPPSLPKASLNPLPPALM